MKKIYAILAIVLFLLTGNFAYATTFYTQPSGLSGLSSQTNVFWYPVATGTASHLRAYFDPSLSGMKVCALTQQGYGTPLWTGGSFYSTTGEIDSNGYVDVYWSTPFTFTSMGGLTNYMWTYFRESSGVVGVDGDGTVCFGNPIPDASNKVYYDGSASWTGNGTADLIKLLVDDDNSSQTPDFSTHIVSLTPIDETVISSTGTTTPITIALSAYVAEEDMGTYSGVRIEFQNIDQNTIFSSLLSFVGVGNTETLFFGNATTSGPFSFTTIKDLPVGNYRINATMQKSYLGIFNGIRVFDEQSSQFIVGTSTWIGSIRQTTFENTDAFFGTLNATSSSALAQSCSPFTSSFGIRECLGFLFIPDTAQLTSTMNSFRDGVLVRVPWGYLTRVYDIFNASSTEALPNISFTFGAGPLEGDVWNIDTNEMVASAGDLLDSAVDRNGNTIRDVLEPLVKLLVSIAVIFSIIMDMTGSHSHSGVGGKKQNV